MSMMAPLGERKAWFEVSEIFHVCSLPPLIFAQIEDWRPTIERNHSVQEIAVRS